MRAAIARGRLRAAEREPSLKTQYKQTATGDGCRSALERFEAVPQTMQRKEAAGDWGRNSPSGELHSCTCSLSVQRCSLHHTPFPVRELVNIRRHVSGRNDPDFRGYF